MQLSSRICPSNEEKTPSLEVPVVNRGHCNQSACPEDATLKHLWETTVALMLIHKNAEAEYRDAG